MRGIRKGMIRSGSILTIFTIVSVCAIQPAQAQVTLNQADLVVIGFGSDDGGFGDSWVLLALDDIPGNSKIFITDRGWNADGNDFTANAFDTTITWTVPAVGVAAGTILHHDSLPGVTSGGPLSLNNVSGDQLLIYQTADGNPASLPTFIYGFNNNDFNPTPGKWQSGTISSTSGTHSNVPAGLIEVTTAGGSGSAFGLAVEADNLYYTGATTNGEKAVLLAAIHNPANWTGSDGSEGNMTENPYNFTATGVFSEISFIVIPPNIEPPGPDPSTPIPEPGTLILFAVGLLGLLGFSRRIILKK